MNPLHRSRLYSGVAALLFCAVALWASLLLHPFLGAYNILIFLAATWASGWYYGRASGLACTAASAVAILYFFLRPEPAFTGISWSIVGRLTLFVLMGGLLTWMAGSLREGRRLFAATLSSIGDAVAATDDEGRVTFLNPVAETLTGWPLAEARGNAVDEVLRFAPGGNGEEAENPIARALRERVVAAPQQPGVLLSRSGSEVPVEHSAAPVRDEDGKVRGAVLVFRDIGKRLQLEEQATHAQKMDAVGRLAGGVAGDFNNVLTVITGYAELLRAEIPSTNPLRRFVDEIIHAGERAAALTGHLLAFSRGATAQPRVVDLNSLVAGMEPMLRRLLGENIELMVLASPGLGRVRIDPAQMEQVIVSLAANARDAMPSGGKFIIETSAAELDEATAKNLGTKAGSYIMLAASDNGIGMDAATRSRVFEPFFTTKAPGKGSGLGLATAYGVVRQADGCVTVYSQPGCGTIFEVYLPRATEAVTQPMRVRSAKGSETILLVDDEEGVRKLVMAVLKSNGYDVVEASNAPAALAVYEKNGHKIDMVLTDVVMPQMSGFDLGKQLQERAPGLKILYMSGYRDNAIGATGAGAARAFLHKPFTPDVLLARVREVLDNDTEAYAPGV